MNKMSFGGQCVLKRDKMDLEKSCFDNNGFVLLEKNLWMPDLVRMNFNFMQYSLYVVIKLIIDFEHL